MNGNMMNPESFRFCPIAGEQARIIEWILSGLEGKVDDNVFFNVNLAVEEVVENVVSYAYEDGNGFLEASKEITGEGILRIVIKDGGVKFNPLDKEDPDITLSAEEREIGGLGIFLCKNLMDKVYYNYENGCNVLVMEKNVA